MVELLRELSELHGVSGNETDVMKYIIRAADAEADSINVDNMGNIIVFKRGKTGGGNRIVVSHTDEIGLIISQITDDGYLKFKAVGDVDTRHIIAKCVKINKTADGVLGMKAIHLQKREEREKTADINSLYIDIGAKNRKQAEKAVNLGDYAAFTTRFWETDDCVMGKALGRSIGCACLLELLNGDYEDNVYFIFASQHEVGMRGAHTAAYGIKADTALIIDGVESADMFGTKPEERAAVLGKGVCIDYMDEYAIFDKNMTREFRTALMYSCIPVQDRHSARGFTDGGAIQRMGIKTMCVGVPIRYEKTPAGMAAKSDIEAAKRAVKLYIEGYGEHK